MQKTIIAVVILFTALMRAQPLKAQDSSGYHILLSTVYKGRPVTAGINYITYAINRYPSGSASDSAYKKAYPSINIHVNLTGFNNDLIKILGDRNHYLDGFVSIIDNAKNKTLRKIKFTGGTFNNGTETFATGYTSPEAASFIITAASVSIDGIPIEP